MSINLEDYFQEFIEKRASDIYQQFTENNNSYIKLKGLFRTTEESLLNSLDNKSKITFMELENIFNSQTSLILTEIYKMALIDGIAISSKVEKFKGADIDFFNKYLPLDPKQ
jgi:hypothetical protein